MVEYLMVAMEGETEITDFSCFAFFNQKIKYTIIDETAVEIIHVVKTEEKNSIVQKFYEPVAEKVVPDISLLQYKQEKKKKDNMSYHLRIKEKDLGQFKKNLKNFVKEHSTKKNNDKFSDYKIQILPFEEE